MQVKVNLRDHLREAADSDFMVNVETSVSVDDIFEMNHIDEELEIDIHDLLAEQRAIALIWDSEQLLTHYPHLTESQAWDVLQECKRNYKGEEGLAWDDISEAVQEMHPDPKERLAERVGRFGRAVADYNGDWPETDNLTDLLADARHWCDAKELDFAQINGTAYEHYLVERNGRE